MARKLRESMKQEIPHDNVNVSGREIPSRTTNMPYKNGVVVMMLTLVTIVMGNIGHEELSKAQSDNMNMDPIIMHIHPQLRILANGTSLSVPAEVGIDPSMWKDHSLDKFGMQSMPEMNMSAMAPLHTHDSSGIVHVESTVNRNYTLGEFLDIWGLDFDEDVVKMSIDNEPSTDFRDHILRDGEQIKLEAPLSRLH